MLVVLLIAAATIRTIESWLIERGLLGAVVLEQGILESVGELDSPDATEVEGGATTRTS